MSSVNYTQNSPVDPSRLSGSRVTGLAPASETYSANNLDQHPAINGVSFSYDGNLTGVGAWTYAHDAEKMAAAHCRN
jgi:hypothetical protein